MMAIALRFFWVGLQALIEFVLKPANLVIAGVLCLVVYGVGFVKGDNSRDAKWVAKVTAERVAQEKTIKATTEKALAENARLAKELEDRDAEITKLLAEADTDANAGRAALGLDSVRRINRGRAGGPQ